MKKKINKTVTQVKDVPLQVMSFGMDESEAMAVQKELSERLTASFSKTNPCQATAMKLGFKMFQHNLTNLHDLCEILELGNALIQWDGKTSNWMVHQALIDILEKKP